MTRRGRHRALGRVLVAATATAAAVGGCAVGPDYQRPEATVPAAFKELAGWKRASPADVGETGAWWRMFEDPLLDGLVARVKVANQTLAANEAALRQARAIVEQSRAGLYPSLGADFSVRRRGGGSGGSSAGIVTTSSANTAGTPTVGFSSRGGSDSAKNVYAPSLTATWDLDVWGRIRRTIESDTANAQASAADLAAATLSAQADLVSTFIQLRALDEQKTLLDAAATAYARSLQITQNQFREGIVARADVAQAQTQLETARSQAIAVGVQRAQFEHAIAVLMGVPPADLDIPPGTLGPQPPLVPPGLPSALLERRPDVAAAERRMAAANAQIGIAEAAYFPDITLTSSVGYASTVLSSLFDSSNLAWSFGAALAQTLFDAGARGAAVDQARASYDQAVATYRQTVLTSFQDVEDRLAALRILDAQAEVQTRAVAAARDAERLVFNQYLAGTVAYTSVVTAQQVALSNEQTALGIRQDRLLAIAGLVQALGGGWSQVEASQGIMGDTKAQPPPDLSVRKASTEHGAAQFR